MVEDDGGRCSACLGFLISFPRSLRNEHALVGEINHHLGSVGGLSQVSELALCKEGEGTHDQIFLCVVEPEGLICSATSVLRPNSPYSWSFNKYLLSISYVSGLVLVLAKDSSIKTQSLP